LLQSPEDLIAWSHRINPAQGINQMAKHTSFGTIKTANAKGKILILTFVDKKVYFDTLDDFRVKGFDIRDATWGYKLFTSAKDALDEVIFWS